MIVTPSIAAERLRWCLKNLQQPRLPWTEHCTMHWDFELLLFSRHCKIIWNHIAIYNLHIWLLNLTDDSPYHIYYQRSTLNSRKVPSPLRDVVEFFQLRKTKHDRSLSRPEENSRPTAWHLDWCCCLYPKMYPKFRHRQQHCLQTAMFFYRDVLKDCKQLVIIFHDIKTIKTFCSHLSMSCTPIWIFW